MVQDNRLIACRKIEMKANMTMGADCGLVSRLPRPSRSQWFFKPLLVALVIPFMELPAFAGSAHHSTGEMHNRAYFGMVVASKSNIRKIIFRAGDGAIYVKKNIGSGVHLVLFSIRSGRYCMTKVRFWHVDIKLGSYGGAVCFHAANGFIGYIGHYIFSPYNENQYVVRFDRFPDFESRVKRRFADVAKRMHIIDLLGLRIASQTLGALRLNAAVNTEERGYVQHVD